MHPHSPPAGGVAESERRQRQADEDRRRAGRVPATFGVSEADGSHVHLCQAEDIAIGGITIKHARGRSHQPRTEVALDEICHDQLARPRGRFEP